VCVCCVCVCLSMSERVCERECRGVFVCMCKTEREREYSLRVGYGVAGKEIQWVCRVGVCSVWCVCENVSERMYL